MMDGQPIVSRAEWIDARRRLLAEEKELTRRRDAMAAQRRALPWLRVDTDYVFTGAQGPLTLAQLFDGRSQLVVYHFMFAPTWDVGCKSCSFWADGFAGVVDHLHARDVTLVAVSRAPLAKLQAFAARLGWRFPWVSSYGTEFNRDFHVSIGPEDVAAGTASYNYVPIDEPVGERPGISVFATDGHGAVFHTYSCYARGLDAMNPAYQYLDLVPKGRDEDGLPHTMAWVRFHDEYGR